MLSLSQSRNPGSPAFLGSGSSRDQSPMRSSVSVDYSHFPYFSFPETSVTQTPTRSTFPCPPSGPDPDSRGSTDPLLIPKTLLGRFKSAIGATVWAPSTSDRASKTAPISSGSLSSASQTNTNLEYDAMLLARSNNRNSSPANTPTRSSDETFYNSRSPRSSLPNLNYPGHHTVTGSPIRPGSSSSIKIHPHPLSASTSLGPLSATPESPRAPFYFQPQNHPNFFPPLTNSESTLRNMAPSNPNVPTQHQGLSAVPTFSHIPGFPLARETIADDGGSLLSSSIAPSSWKGAATGCDDVSQSAASYQLMDKIQGEGLSREYWMPDKDAKECYDCAATFTSWRRKHHCRICGAIFCHFCASNLVSGRRFASAGYIRVCNMCLAKLEPVPEGPWRLREDPEEENNASVPEAGSSFHIFGSRSHAARMAHSRTRTSLASSKARDRAKSSSQSALSYSTRHSSHRSNSRTRPDYHNGADFNEKSRHTDAARSTSFLSNPFHASSTTLKPITQSRNAETSGSHQIPQSAVSCLTAPFRKGLNDGEQTGLPHLKIIQPSQRLVTPTPSTVKASLSSRPASLERLQCFEYSSSRRQSKRLAQDLRTESQSPTKEPAPKQAAYQDDFNNYLSKDSPKGPSDILPPWPPWGPLDGPAEFHLSSASLAHLRSMIRQCLHRDKVSKAPTWECELIKLLVKMVSDPPRPNQDEGHPGDIRQLIKIKKIPGGQPQDSEYVHGVVFTKNVVHKQMRVECITPRVLAVSIPLEFQRVEGYMKLEPLIFQEKQYLKSLVNRLTSLRPDVLLVEGDVSGLAIEYLVQAGVSVVRHVKPRVLQAVAQCTQAPVISSLDKLLNLKVGQCDVFHVQTLDHRLIPGRRKSFIRLEGCRPDLGGTLLLRGGHLSLLSKIKALMSMMVHIVYSSRLETHFLRDEGAIMTPDLESVRKSQVLDMDKTEIQNILTSFRRARRQLIDTKFTVLLKPGCPQKPAISATPATLPNLARQIEDILRPYERIVLSGSPTVKLAPPVVLTRLRDLHQELTALRQSIKQRQPIPPAQSEAKQNSIHEAPTTPNTPSLPPNPPTLEHSVDGSQASSSRAEALSSTKALMMSEEYSQTLRVAELGRQLVQSKLAAAHYLSTHRPETFHPADHQRIVVQEALVCRNPTTGLPSYTCQGPQLRSFSYYLPGDQTVGQIIELAVACQGQMCPAKGCGQLKNVHQTDYIHGRFKASLRIHHSLQPESAIPQSTTDSASLNESRHSVDNSDMNMDSANQDMILMQSYCPHCDGHTRKTEMSEDSWRLSFGKYLELCFYGQGIQAEYVTHDSTGLRLPCPHDLHLGHTRIFFHRGFRIDFSLRRINVYEAISPSLCLTANSQAQWRVLEDEYYTIHKRSKAFFNSVRLRINAFNYDVVTLEKQDASEEAMRELLKKVESDAQMIQLQLDEVHLACVGTNGVKINTVRKTLVDKAVEWDHVFATFELRFIAEHKNDARRLTSVQLRKLFVDQTTTPGSPDRLLSRLQQLPAFNSSKYNYTSQSEVDSDHAGQKSAATVSFKKAFPSPTLKTMASALAFALPTSMPTLGPSFTDGRLESSATKSNGPSALDSELTSTSPSPKQSASIAELDGGMNTRSLSSQSKANGQPENLASSSVRPATTSTPSDSTDNTAGTLSSDSQTSPSAKTVMTSDAAKAPEDDHPDAITVKGKRTSMSIAQPPSVRFISSSPGTSPAEVFQDATPKGRLTVTQRQGLNTSIDCDDGFESDTTVINARDQDTLNLHLRAKIDHSNEANPSDTDTTNQSEAESQEDPRRLTIRGRRILEIGPSNKGGVANLVQKFEKPTTKELQLNAPVVSEEIPGEPSPSALIARPTNKIAKAPTPVARPGFKRGKSEIVRSASHLSRGKRPISQTIKSPAESNFSSRSHSSTKLVDQNSNHNNLTSRLAARHQLRLTNKSLASKIAPDEQVRSSKTQLTSVRLNPVPEPVLRSAPRLRDTTSRRHRPDSGLPISSSYLSRRANQPYNSKVTTMTRHFDRMSREAERQKHSHEHRSRPRPIAHAKSSVHAFSSLTAAVHEDSDSDLDECNVNPAEHDADDEGDVTPEAYGPETPEPGVSNLPRAASPLATDFAEQDNIVCPLGTSLSLEEGDSIGFPHSDLLIGPDRSLVAQTTPCSPSFLADSFRIPPSGFSQFSDNEMSSGEAGRHSIIKTLSNLWSYRGAEFSPLEYPQLPTEHQSAENPVLIREDEPSSIIAYTLGSKLYQDTLKDTEPRVIERSEIFMPEDVKIHGADYDSTWGMIDFAPQDMDVDDTLKVPTNGTKPMQFRYDVAPCTITCKVFFMHQFEGLRKTLGCKDIVESLARCHKWDASGGKSGQNFLKTKDGRYLIKGISKTELEALTKFAPAYFEYLSSACREKRPITLAKMLGIFQISFINKTTNRKGKLQVQVIENLWASKSDLQIYDLKGLTRNRTVNVTGRPNEVLLDGNFCEMARTNQIFMHEDSLLRLQASLHNDTLFLASNNVMDYSLAIGIDEENQELYVGIIDYLRTYSWDKRLETLVKELGGSSKEAPTIITPSLYKARFRRAMARYFIVSPDAWLRWWQPYLMQSDEDTEREGIRSTETATRAEDTYIHLLSHR
ncbi:hypothetical protein CROQUDRAFT_78200 [Cronartium quercuum f. sp. fusiforme G11]|uniref:1-phosphatidylinositol-3-phosphate 5-kinase n=1 Tax=Cronartium quercuum f. sp. fusiforme G11 TaxID=708437 RepID=A0A9P6TCV5_9BASI|nr:hypothetical protein CROQUDRAFT_78200 [Cronartium quercuum f. sp. fusiforme G11]